MFHKQFKNSDVRTTFDIQTNVSKLLITAKFVSGWCTHDAAVLSPTQRAVKLAYALRAALNGKMSVTRHTNGVAKTLINSMPLADLAEIAANNEGFIYIKTDTVNNTTGVGNVTAMFSVELSNEGSIRTNQSDFLKVDLEGFGLTNDQSANGGAQDVTLTINSFGAYVAKNEHIKYSPVACQGGSNVQFDCQSHYMLAVPGDNIEKLTLSSVTGESMEIIKEELEVISADLSDIVYNVDGRCIPFLVWRLIPVQPAYKANVRLVNNGQCYLIGNKSYE